MVLLESQIYDDALFGVCVIDFENGVLYQNQKCRDFCYGSGVPALPATDECIIQAMAQKYPTEGIFYKSSVQVRDGFFDIVFIRDGKQTSCFLYPQDRKIESFEKIFRAAKLTQRELEITSMVILGMTNEKVCDKLRITKNTLRTHLKSVYRKLPPNSLEILGLFRKF